MEKIAFAGTFDPLTNGHLWVIQEALNIADQVVVIIAQNQTKNTWFSAAERKEMVDDVLRSLGISDRVTSIILQHQYTAQAAVQLGCNYLIRGIRSSLDFDYESLIQKTNTDVLSGAKTLFVIPPRELESVSSSFIKSLVGPIGWHWYIKQFIPHAVYDRWLSEFIKQEAKVFIGQDSISEHARDQLIEMVLNQYRGRDYHGLEHLTHCLQELKWFLQAQTSISKQESAQLCLAILAHDFILYANDPQKSDEMLSAEWFEEQAHALHFSNHITNSVKALILATNYLSERSVESTLEQIICDIDLSILGQPQATYAIYCNAVREEYNHLDDITFNRGRIEVLNKLLNQKQLYKHSYFSRYETIAKDNMLKEITLRDKKTPNNV